MKEGTEFIGRKYSEEEKENISEVLDQWSEKASQPFEGELEKTEEQILVIEISNSIIQSELESLGIEGYEPMPLEKIHLLTDDIYKENFPHSNNRAFFLSTYDSVCVRVDDRYSKSSLLSTLVHELIHRASTQKFYVDETKGIKDARTGYRLRSSWKQEREGNQFRGFNETMVDNTVYKILVKNQQLLEKNLGITKEDIDGPIYAYMGYADILGSIIKKISKDTHKKISEVFNDLERGQFENSILALKDVERSFGEGSLRILSRLEPPRKGDDSKLLDMIRSYFAEDGEEKRQIIGQKIREIPPPSEEVSSDVV